MQMSKSPIISGYENIATENKILQIEKNMVNGQH